MICSGVGSELASGAFLDENNDENGRLKVDDGGGGGERGSV